MSEHDQRVFGIPEPEDTPAADQVPHISLTEAPVDNINESNEGFAVPADQVPHISLTEAPVEAPAGQVPHISLTEAPVEAPAGQVGVRVNVEAIMDQIHQHWARQMADQIQRNAELAAALTVTSEELEELKGKYAALTEVTNAPADDKPSAVRDIPAGGPVGRQED